MPELPEAQVAVDQLNRCIVGARVTSWWLGRPDIVRQGLESMDWLEGARVEKVTRCGKSIVVKFEQSSVSKYLVAELGMTGLVFFRQPNSRYRKHTHFIMKMKGGLESEFQYWNARRFGRLYCFEEDELQMFTKKRFGYDPLTISWTTFRTLIKSRRRRIKPLLMHQQVIAGIGNIYANEILYRARLHPYRLSHKLQDRSIRRLYEDMLIILRQAIQDGGSSIRDYIAPNGEKGCFQTKHLVYDKAGELCSFHCGRTIRRLLGERSSFFCPSCQRL